MCDAELKRILCMQDNSKAKSATKQSKLPKNGKAVKNPSLPTTPKGSKTPVAETNGVSGMRLEEALSTIRVTSTQHCTEALCCWVSHLMH